MRSIALVTAAVALMLLPQAGRAGPEERALAYHRYSYGGDLEQAYALLAPTERGRLSFEEFADCPGSRRMTSHDTELIRSTDGGLAVVIGPIPPRVRPGNAFYLPPPRVAVRVTLEDGAWYVTLPDCPAATVTTAR
jgi:hypothetical protein